MEVQALLFGLRCARIMEIQALLFGFRNAKKETKNYGNLAFATCCFFFALPKQKVVLEF